MHDKINVTSSLMCLKCDMSKVGVSDKTLMENLKKEKLKSDDIIREHLGYLTHIAAWQL